MNKENEPKTTEISEEERRRRRKVALAKMGVMLLFFLIVLAFATAAWFTMNKENAASGMGVKVGTMPFELKTQGYYGYYDDYLPEEYLRIEDDLETAGLPVAGTNGTLSTVNGSSIQWLISADDNAKNYVTATTKEDEKGIRPGTSGQMKFWIASNGPETISIRFKLSIDPYKTNYQLDQNNNIIFDGNGVPCQDTPTSIANDANYATVISYLKSHVMFFKTRTTVKKADNTFSHYTYSNLIPLDTEFNLVYDDVSASFVNTLTFTLDGTDYQDEPFYIYWVWPETLAEAVLPENMQNNGKHALCPDGEIFTEFKRNPALYLHGYNATTDTNGTANVALTQAIVYQYYSKLSLEYNNADQEIGDSIGYFVLELDAIG